MTLFSRGVRALPSYALAVAALVSGGSALAQTITLPSPTTDFRTASGRTGTTEVIYGLSRADCEADLVYTFHPTIATWSTGEFQVWASNTADCKSKDARTATSNRQCWQVATPTPAFINGSLTVPIKGRDLVSYVGKSPPDVYTPADVTACTNQSGTAAVKITLYFLIVDSSSKEALGTGASYGLSTDLLAPSAPDITSIEVKNQALKVNWGTTTDVDILTYDICRDDGVPVASAGVIDAGTPDGAGLGVGGSACAPIGGDAGTTSTTGDAETTADAEATLDTGTPDASAIDASDTDVQVSPDITTTLTCASEGKGVTSHTFDGLDNDKVYTFVLKARDALGNQGDVGAAACQYASTTSNFFDAYSAAGGQAGGGFCSIGHGSLTGLTSIAMGVACLALLRRKRRS